MSEEKDHHFPEIDTEDFELALSDSQRQQFLKDRPAFVHLLDRLVVELGLQGQIEHLEICKPARCRAELYREPGNAWPSKRLCLDIYPDRYMDEHLLRHELGHEADRWNPKMLYDPAIEERWKRCWAFNLAANISLDRRLGDGGLGKEMRREDFQAELGEEHGDVFEEVWADPPKTWPQIEALATKLSALQTKNKNPLRCPNQGNSTQTMVKGGERVRER